MVGFSESMNLQFTICWNQLKTVQVGKLWNCVVVFSQIVCSTWIVWVCLHLLPVLPKLLVEVVKFVFVNYETSFPRFIRPTTLISLLEPTYLKFESISLIIKCILLLFLVGRWLVCSAITYWKLRPRVLHGSVEGDEIQHWVLQCWGERRCISIR